MKTLLFMLLSCLAAPAIGQSTSQSVFLDAAHASEAYKQDAADVAKTAQAKAQQAAKLKGPEIKAAVAAADRARANYLQEMYKQNLPPQLAKTVSNQGEHILFFASKSMQDGDMRGLMETALADKRITILFLGGEPDGGVKALTTWLSAVGRGLPRLPAIEIDPPSFHKYHVTQVPLAVVLRDGKEVARVGGVYSTRWIDTALTSRHGDLGSYGAMTFPSETDMEQLLKDRLAHVDWKAYTDHAVANFWRDQKLTPVPHATKPDLYEIDPSITITHDVVLPDGSKLAHAGERINPLKVAPFTPTLLVIDASDPAQRAFAHDQVLNGAAADLIVMSTAVPATAPDGWAAWSSWQDAIGAHLYLYSAAYAKRLKLSATPSFVTGNGLTLKVRQVVVQNQGSK